MALKADTDPEKEAWSSLGQGPAGLEILESNRDMNVAMKNPWFTVLFFKFCFKKQDRGWERDSECLPACYTESLGFQPSTV